MWFLNRRRRPQLDPVALERLTDTIARAIALIEERLAPRQPDEARATLDVVVRELPPSRAAVDEVPAAPAPAPAADVPTALQPVEEPELENATAEGFVLFVPTPAGYRLVTPQGVVPALGERLSVDDRWYRVLRLGPSPLPADGRSCVFLEDEVATLD